MNYSKLIISILILVIIGYIYKNIEKNEKNSKINVDYDLVRKYLFNEKSLAKNKKPILWIPITIEKNSRKWETFYSRSDYKLNQDYLHLCINTIVNRCKDDFHICLFDHNSLKQLLPTLNINLDRISNPINSHLFHLCICYILYNYGGLVIPPSFVCFNSFINYYKTLDSNSILIGELKNNYTNNNNLFYPNSLFIGCNKDSTKMKEYINYLQYENSNNFTSSFDFENLNNKWFINKENIYKIPAKKLGVVNSDNNIVYLDDLFNDSFISFDSNILGIYIPEKELLKRIKYNWFTYLTNYQVLISNTTIGKYILINQ